MAETKTYAQQQNIKYTKIRYDVFEKPLHSQGFYDIILRSQKSTHMAV